VANAQTASFVALAQSASNAVSAQTASFANTFTVASTLTAQTLVVQTITSSVDFVTGSTRFGSIADNTHVFTGSLLLSGSSTALNVNNGSLFISSSGNVGIGTSTPIDLLTLYRNGNVENNISIYNGTAGYGTHLRLLAADNAGAGYNTISSYTNGGTTHWTIGSGATTSTMVFYTNNDVEKMRITSAGNVGIGTNSPNDLLEIKSTTANQANVRLYNTFNDGSNAYGISWFRNYDSATNSQACFINYIREGGSGGYMSFGTGTVGSITSRMVITSGGNIGIGTTSPNIIAAGGPCLDLRGPTWSFIELGTSSTVSGSTDIGYLEFMNGNNTRLATIVGATDGTALAGAMRFSTANSSGGFTERMRINSTGSVGIGTSSPSGILHVQGVQDGVANKNLRLSYNGTYYAEYTENTIRVFNNDLIIGTGSGGEKMRITSGGSVYIGLTSSGTNVFAVSYNAIVSSLYVTNAGSIGSYTFGTGPVYANAGLLTMTNPSDSRLKDNINNISWGLSDILKLRPVSYHWKDDKANQGKQFGFVAQEVQEVMPEAIKEFGEDTKYLGLEKDAIYATLVKAIQELKTQNDDLQSQINELKAQ
jgi:hypothetical protein